MRSNHIAISMLIKAPANKVWSSIADWESQGDWMLQTTVSRTSEISEGVGVKIEAFTGPLYRLYPRFKFLGLLDLMEVTRWEPPHRCDVIHYGKILKGSGTFEVVALDNNHTTFHWSEEVIAPRLLFIMVKPFLWLGVKISLSRFARLLE
ncbi:SRPBCC domain containing protein [Candidatus Nanopelagicaceae bacterium]